MDDPFYSRGFKIFSESSGIERKTRISGMSKGNSCQIPKWMPRNFQTRSMRAFFRESEICFVLSPTTISHK